MANLLVLGAGNFGTALALHLARQNHDVYIWDRDHELIETMNSSRKNERYLSQFELPANIYPIKSFWERIQLSFDAAIIAVPTQGIRDVLPYLSKLQLIPLVICASKGIELDSLKLPIDIVRETLGASAASKMVILSGPSFAGEVAEKLPTAVTVASEQSSSSLFAQEIFHSAYFRTYTSNDPIGLEVAGALKNVIALAAGALTGIGFQMNSRAALITRGLAEITRVGITMGANPLTFIGLGGVGDLFLTCSSEKSRNFRVGFELGKGNPLDQVLRNLGSVAEGVYTSKAAFQLSQRLRVDTPIINGVYAVIYEHKPIADALSEILNRDAKAELELR